MERWNLQRLTLAFLILLPLLSAAPPPKNGIPPGQAKKLLDAKPPVQESPTAPNPQQTEVSLVCASSIVDLVFVVDGSNSVCQNDTLYGKGNNAACTNWNYMLQFLYDFVADFTISQSYTRVGLITFANEGRVEWKLQQHQNNKKALQDAILKLRYPGGARNTADGIRLLRTKIFDQNSRDKRQAPRPKAAIFVTDGVPTQTEKFPAEVKAAHDAGIVTFAVGVSNRVNEPVLKMLSSPPQQSNSDYYSIQAYSQIMSILTLLKRRTCTLFFNPVPPTLPPVLTTPAKVKTTKAAKTNPPQTNPADCVTYPMDLVFMLDGSSSICESDPKYKSNKDKTCDNYNHVLKFITKFVQDLDIGPTGTRVSLVTFASDSVLRWRLGTYTRRNDLVKAIKDLPYTGGNTDTAGGLRTVLTQAFGGSDDRAYAPNTLIIVTDGKPSDPNGAAAEVARVQAAGIKTYVVGVTSNVDEATLQQFSSYPHQKNQNYFTATDFKNIELMLQSLQRATICRSYSTTLLPIVTTRPPVPSSSKSPTIIYGTTASEIRVCSEDNKQDIVFVLDASGSICGSDPDYVYGVDTNCNNFKFILDFVANIVQNMDIGPDRTRVGVVTFSADAEVIFDLSQYTNKDDLINAILNIPYIGSQTQTARGLEVMRTQVFGVNGDRPDVPNTAVVITDGQPTDAAAVPGEVQRVHDQGITTYAIGVTNEVNEQTLQELSSAPHQKDENYFIASDFSSIDYIRDTFQYAAICSSNTPADNNLETTMSTATVAITVKDCGSDHRQDIVFVIDRSGSICDSDANYVYLQDTNCNNFKSLLDFVANIVQTLDIGLDQTRVGLVAFSNDASVAWDLSTHTTKDELVNAIRNLPYDGGETYQDKGLDLMRTRVFGANGDRPDVNNTAIILTDGMPSDPAAVPPVIQLVHAQGITTYAIGVTNQINEDNLKLLSSAPGQKDQNYFVATDFSTMEYIRQKVQSAATCQ